MKVLQGAISAIKEVQIRKQEVTLKAQEKRLAPLKIFGDETSVDTTITAEPQVHIIDTKKESIRVNRAKELPTLVTLENGTSGKLNIVYGIINDASLAIRFSDTTSNQISVATFPFKGRTISNEDGTMYREYDAIGQVTLDTGAVLSVVADAASNSRDLNVKFELAKVTPVSDNSVEA